MAIAVVLCCTCIFPFPPNHQFPSRGNNRIYFLYYGGCKMSPSYPKISVRLQIFPSKGRYLDPLRRTESMTRLALTFWYIKHKNSSKQSIT